MQRIISRWFICLFIMNTLLIQVSAQPGKRPASSKQPASSQPDMNKMLEEAMKAEGMSKEEQEEMKKMMKGVMPSLEATNSQQADYPEFTNNKQLVPAKNIARINTISKTKLTQPAVSGYATTLFNKILARADAEEIDIIKKVTARYKKASDIGSTAVLCMQQGYPLAAMALSMKAIQMDPSNRIWQNNMASLLTQYGYPEQAIPVLNKLISEQPNNSTFLNNMAYAWLGLGETDSVRRFAGMAASVNPFNPDANLCGGLMEELHGYPVKAAHDYIESLTDAVSPFTESMLKNSNNQDKIKDIDFEKIKKTIAIHEYFPRNWFPEIPRLSSGVNEYAADEAKKDGFQVIRDSIVDKLERIHLVLNKGLDNLFEEGEEKFITTMANETIEGLSFMSKPAVLVLGILSQYQLTRQLKFTEEVKALEKTISIHRTEYERRIKNLKPDECAKADKAANDFMSTVNPMIYKFYTENAEKQRQWMNAWITWNWYVAGNPKNSILIQDMGFVGLLTDTYHAAIAGQVTINGNCKPQREQAPDKIKEPEIPDFSCPAIVSIPSGKGWAELAAASKNFNANSLNIKKSNKPVPNTSICYTTGSRVGQPGIDPFLKTVNGSISPGYISKTESIDAEEAAHQSNLNMIEAIPGLSEMRHRKNLEMIKKLPYWSEVVAARNLLNKVMSTACSKQPKNKKPKFVIGEGKLEFEDVGPKIISQEDKDDVVTVEYEDGSAAVFFPDGGILEIEAPTTYTVVDKPEPVKNKNAVPLKQFKTDYDNDGFLPSLSNSLQMPNVFTVIINLFK